MLQYKQIMTKNLTIKSCFRFIILVLVVILIVTGIVEFIQFNDTINSLNKNNTDYDSISHKIIFLRTCMAIGLVLILSLIAFTLFILDKVMKKSSQELIEKEKEIDEMQKEFINQQQMINSTTKLYNDSLEYDRIKTEFFSNMSHELKTPLSVILGAIQLISHKTSVLPDERRKPHKHLRTIKQNCYRLVRLINNILDITRIDSGYIKMNLVNCNIVYLIEEITMSVAPYSEQKGLSLEFDTEEEEIVTAVDVDKIERILLNLLSNAIKFTEPNGKVSVTIKIKNNLISISVKDNGLGIPPDMQSSIFERFHQADNALTRISEGSGIGLSIVKSFVELHNGTIMLISEENKGSEFTIDLPIKLCESNIANESNQNNYRNKIVEAINIEFSDIYTIAS